MICAFLVYIDFVEKNVRIREGCISNICERAAIYITVI